jgi:hypothetical protein
MAGHNSLVHGGKFMSGPESFGGKDQGNTFCSNSFSFWVTDGWLCCTVGLLCRVIGVADTISGVMGWLDIFC